MSPISCILYQALLTGTGMNLDSLAYFLAKNLVEIPRLMLLTIAYLSTFIHYPQIIFLCTRFFVEQQQQQQQQNPNNTQVHFIPLPIQLCTFQNTFGCAFLQFGTLPESHIRQAL